MSDSPRLRIATPNDLEAVLALMNDPASVHQREACMHRERPETGAQLYDRLNEDCNLVIEASGSVAGYASWQSYGRHAHLNVMTIAARFQRSGLGRALFTGFSSDLRADGMLSLSLRAYRDSHWAIAFYQGQGLKRYETGMERGLADDGFLKYLRLAIANGQWPAEDKVTFFAPLAWLVDGSTK